MNSGASPLKLDANRVSDRISARQIVAEESRRGHEEIRASQPRYDEVAQAAANRIAHEQRAGQHGYRSGNAQHHRQMGSPVEGEATKDELGTAHALTTAPCVNLTLGGAGLSR